MKEFLTNALRRQEQSKNKRISKGADMLNALAICGLYIILLFSLTKLFGVKYTEIAASTENIKKGIVYPIGISTVVLTAFAFAYNWLPDVLTFSPRITQPILWLIPFVTVVGIAARFSLLNSKAFKNNGLIFLVFGTLLVGFSEELLVRGIAVSALQKSGYSVLLAGILSSVIFGLLHFMNYFNGQDIKKTTVQVGGTILMGLNFYIIYVISGTLWVPIIMHFLYDLSILAMGPDPDIDGRKIMPVISATTIGMFILPLVGLFFLH